MAGRRFHGQFMHGLSTYAGECWSCHGGGEDDENDEDDEDDEDENDHNDADITH